VANSGLYCCSFHSRLFLVMNETSSVVVDPSPSYENNIGAGEYPSVIILDTITEDFT
jgi:hypothetical protein